MSLPKIAGIETEFGIVIRGAVDSDPFLASRVLLEHCPGRMPRRVAMGPQPSQAAAPATGSTWRSLPQRLRGATAAGREPEGGEAIDSGGFDASDMMLPNGARFYIDHAHPEYSTAEAATPRGVVAADKAGELIVAEACRRANASGWLPHGQQIAIYKNNSDHKGNSYGCHENYLLAPDTFDALIERKLQRTLRVLVPFLVTRPLLCGAGKAGAENGTSPAGFQLSQRADFFETLIGLQTTHHRPIINTRDEPHADRQRFRRLHVIAGDANMSEFSTFIKVGATSLVLMMLEDEAIPLDLTLDDPVSAAQQISRDLTFDRPVALASGGAMTALQMQREILACATEYVENNGLRQMYGDVIEEWSDTLDKLSRDWRLLSRRVDWAIKRNFLERYLAGQRADWDMVRRWQTLIEVTLDFERLEREDAAEGTVAAIRSHYGHKANALERYAADLELDWGDYWPQRDIYFALRHLDIEYHDIRRGATAAEMGLFHRLQAGGAVDRLLTDEEIERFAHTPPADTRAYLRGQCLARFGGLVDRADWEELAFRGPGMLGSHRLSMPDPTAGCASAVGALLENVTDLQTLLAALQARPFGDITADNELERAR